MEDTRTNNAQKEQFHVQMCNRVNELDASVEADREDMLNWISDNSENFTRLRYPTKQYFPEICNIFVCSRLKKSDEASGKNRFCYSLDFIPCIKLDYATYKNEEIEYYDSELNIITYLESQFLAVFKIIDCMKMLKALDINAADLSIGNVYERLRMLSLQAWREVVMDCVENDKIGFYHFAQNFSTIATKLSTVLNKKLEPYGITTHGIDVTRMSIPESVREQIRQNSYELKCESDRYTSEAKFASIYLENYRKKAEIQSTYGVSDTLTEFEKDRALERYLVRVNNERKTAVTETHLEERDDNYILDKPVEPKAPTITKPEKPDLTSKNTSLIAGSVIGVVLLIIGSIIMSLAPSAEGFGIALLVIGILIFIICIAILVIHIITFKEKSATLQKSFEENLKLYEDAQKQYKLDMETYEKAMKKYKARLSDKSKN